MKNKPGFSPISILVALTIGSTVTLIVMQAISQLTRTLTRTTVMTQTDMAVTLGIKILEQDLSSICMPSYVHFKEKEEKKEKSEGSKEQKPVSKDEKKEEKEYFKKAFCIKQQHTILEKISCISMYSIAKDHIAPKKVFYTLEEDGKSEEKTYTLYRQECSNLQAEAADSKTEQKFVVLKNIVSLTCTCWARPLPKEEKKDQEQAVEKDKNKKEEKKEKEPYKSFTEWDSESNLKNKKEETQWPLLPDFIDITIVMQQEKGQRATYSTTIMTPCGFPELLLTDVVPVAHQQVPKEKLSPQEQINALTNTTDFSPTIHPKVTNLSTSMNQKDKK